MSPEHDRRQNPPPTSDTTGWHSLEFIVRQALEVQRDTGTATAVQFLQNIGVRPEVISRVLAPDRKVRAADEEALASPAAVSDLPVASAQTYWRRKI